MLTEFNLFTFEVSLIVGVIAFVLGVVFSPKILDTIKGVPADLRAALKNVEADGIAKIAAAHATAVATLPAVVAAKAAAPAAKTADAPVAKAALAPAAATGFVAPAAEPVEKVALAPGPTAPNSNAATPTIVSGPGPGPAVQ